MINSNPNPIKVNQPIHETCKEAETTCVCRKWEVFCPRFEEGIHGFLPRVSTQAMVLL